MNFPRNIARGGGGGTAPGGAPGNFPGTWMRSQEVSREIHWARVRNPGKFTGVLPGDAFSGKPPVDFPRNPGGRISRKTPGGFPAESTVEAFRGERISREIPIRSHRMSSTGKAYFESRGVPRETHFPGHSRNDVISEIVPGKGASPVPVSAELPGP